jgi:hypothetical protein
MEGVFRGTPCSGNAPLIFSPPGDWVSITLLTNMVCLAHAQCPVLYSLAFAGTCFGLCWVER